MAEIMSSQPFVDIFAQTNISTPGSSTFQDIDTKHPG
jgi:hypothetical protein